MKLKYKKMVLLVTMSTMFIGLVVFSIVSPSKETTKDADKTTKVEETKKSDKKQKEESTSTPKATATPEVTATPTPTKEPETLLKKDSDKKIVKLVKDYFDLGLKNDIDGLKKIHTDKSLIMKEEIKAKYKYVEDVKNIECYTMDGPEKGSYLVYIYSEFKFKDIKTLAPGLSRLYVTETKDGDLKIFNGADAKINEYILKADKEAEVQALVDKVSVKLEEALSKDADLKKFNEEVLNKKEDKSTEDKSSKDTSSKNMSTEDKSSKGESSKDKSSKEKSSKDKKSDSKSKKSKKETKKS